MGHVEIQEEKTQQSGMYGNLVKIQALRVGGWGALMVLSSVIFLALRVTPSPTALVLSGVTLEMLIPSLAHSY